jgi:hypothetical protein
MPSARNIAGNIAKLLGRPESEGWVFTRLFQDRGVFLKGHGGRGGAGTYAADSREAVLLLLAMALSTGPTAAVKDAAALYMLPFLDVRRYRLGPDVEQWEHLPPDPQIPALFGDCLAYIIDTWRCGARQHGPMCAALRFGVEEGVMRAEVISHRLDRGETQFEEFNGLRYALEAAIGVPHFLICRSASFSGAILDEIAKALGPLRGSGGGDLTEPRSIPDEEDESEPLAAQSPASPVRPGGRA